MSTELKAQIACCLRIGATATVLELIEGFRCHECSSRAAVSKDHVAAPCPSSFFVEPLLDIPSQECDYYNWMFLTKQRGEASKFLMETTRNLKSRMSDPKLPPYPTLLGMAIGYRNLPVVKAMLAAEAMKVLKAASDVVCEHGEAFLWDEKTEVTSADITRQTLLERCVPIAILRHHFLSVVITNMKRKPPLRGQLMSDAEVAVFEQNMELLELLLEAGCDVNFGTVGAPSYFFGLVPIIYQAVRVVRDEALFSRVFALLSRFNVNVNALDGANSAPIELAAIRDDVGLVRLLLESGKCRVAVTHPNDQRQTWFCGQSLTLLQTSANNHSLKCLELLLTYNVITEVSVPDASPIFTFDIDSVEPDRDMAPIHLIFTTSTSLKSHITDAMRLLISHGADVNGLCSRDVDEDDKWLVAEDKDTDSEALYGGPSTIYLPPVGLLLVSEPSDLMTDDEDDQAPQQPYLLEQVQMFLDSGADTSFLYGKAVEDEHVLTTTVSLDEGRERGEWSRCINRFPKGLRQLLQREAGYI